MAESQQQALYKEALTKLSKGEEGLAAQELLQILKSGYESADVYYYLARAYLKENNYGQAIVYLQKSLARDRFNFETRNELAFVQNKIEGGLALPSDHPYEIAYNLKSFIHPQEAFFGTGLLLFVYFTLRYLGKINKIVSRSLLIVAFLFLVLGFAASFGSRIVTVQTKAPLYESPLEEASVLKEFPQGSRLIRERKEKNFSRVFRGTSRGWIKNEAIAEAID